MNVPLAVNSVNGVISQICPLESVVPLKMESPPNVDVAFTLALATPLPDMLMTLKLTYHWTMILFIPRFQQIFERSKVVFRNRLKLLLMSPLLKYRSQVVVALIEELINELLIPVSI